MALARAVADGGSVLDYLTKQRPWKEVCRPKDGGRAFDLLLVLAQRHERLVTKQELLDAGGISSKTFDLIRKAARVRGPGHGGLNWVFSREDVRALIHRASSGRFTERGPAAAAGWEEMLRKAGVNDEGSLRNR